MVKSVDKNEWTGRKEIDVERVSDLCSIFLSASRHSYKSITICNFVALVPRFGLLGREKKITVIRSKSR